MKLWTEQAARILAMLKLRKEFRVLDNYGDAKWITEPDGLGKLGRRWDRIKGKTVDMLHIKSRRRWTFSRADFNRAKLALKGY